MLVLLAKYFLGDLIRRIKWTGHVACVGKKIRAVYVGGKERDHVDEVSIYERMILK
jgi:hypothetical protein